MNRGRKLLLAGLVTAAALGTSYLVWRGSGVTLEDAPITAPPVDMSMQGVELTRTAGDGSRWTLIAERADYEQADGKITVEVPEIIWSKEGRDSVTIKAAKGLVDQASGSAELWPDVVVKSGDVTVYSKRLEYNGLERTITVREDVRIERAGMTLEAPQVFYDLTSNEITATGGVTAMLQSKAAPVGEETP